MPQSHPPAYTYRILPDDEWDVLDPIRELGPIPPAGQALCIVIETSEDVPQIAGALFLQSQLHAEPFVILPQYRESGVSAHGAFGLLEAVLTEEFELPLMYHVLVADQPEVLEAARQWGMKPLSDLGYVPHVKLLA